MDVSILSEVRCHLGEGATYDVATDTAWWFDILEKRLFEAAP
jgi:sugar lactone lactonase YvrE